MSLKIRLARGGAKKRPYYRIVVADSRMPRDGRYIEKIGSFNPMLPKDHADRVLFDAERVKHWMSVGAKPTDRVARFLAAAEMGERLIPRQTKKAEQSERTKERIREKEEKLAAAAEAAAEAEAAATEEAAAE